MLNCYIVDDELHAISVLERYIAKTPGITLAGSSNDSVTGLDSVKQIKPDIIFLDVDMPGLSGLEFLQLLTDKSGVVFTTASAVHAVEAYSNNLSDYLLKPISYERFLNCILKQQNRLGSDKKPVVNSDHFFVQCELKSKIIRIAFSDIQYVESLNNYVMIFHNDQKSVVYITMKEVLEFLPAQHFSRVHKSFIINDNKIQTIVGNQIGLTGKEQRSITIGQTYRETFFNKINGKILKRHA